VLSVKSQKATEIQQNDRDDDSASVSTASGDEIEISDDVAESLPEETEEAVAAAPVAMNEAVHEAPTLPPFKTSGSQTPLALKLAASAELDSEDRLVFPARGREVDQTAREQVDRTLTTEPHMCAAEADATVEEAATSAVKESPGAIASREDNQAGEHVDKAMDIEPSICAADVEPPVEEVAKSAVEGSPNTAVSQEPSVAGITQREDVQVAVVRVRRRDILAGHVRRSGVAVRRMVGSLRRHSRD